MGITGKVLKWTTSNKLFAYPRRKLAKIVKQIVESRGGLISFNLTPDSAEALSVVEKIRVEIPPSMTQHEAIQIYKYVRRTEKIDGDIVEVGVYRGGSAKLICEANRVGSRQREVYLFDTFEGLPEPTKEDSGKFTKGQFSSTLEQVEKYLLEYQFVKIYKGLFPTTAESIKDKHFSFVHLDVDLYQETLNSLRFLYPRMTRGGVIISHNYTDTPGVKKAFDEFLLANPEILIELGDSQCMIVKLGV